MDGLSLVKNGFGAWYRWRRTGYYLWQRRALLASLMVDRPLPRDREKMDGVPQIRRKDTSAPADRAAVGCDVVNGRISVTLFGDRGVQIGEIRVDPGQNLFLRA